MAAWVAETCRRYTVCIIYFLTLLFVCCFHIISISVYMSTGTKNFTCIRFCWLVVQKISTGLRQDCGFSHYVVYSAVVYPNMPQWECRITPYFLLFNIKIINQSVLWCYELWLKCSLVIRNRSIIGTALWKYLRNI